jgi:putative tricarboxylic transport membrane protein
MIMGVVIAMRAILARGEEIGGWAVRPLLILSVAILVFAYAMDPLGFVPALVLLIIGSALASREFRVLEALVLAAVLIVGAVAIFIYGIELPYRLFWWSY